MSKKLAIGPHMVTMLGPNDRIVDHLHEGKPFEPRTRAIFSMYCIKGREVIDVGAYNGLFAIGAALHGCKVIAIEPMVFNYDRFLANITANMHPLTGSGVGAIKLHKAVATDHVGKATITFNPKVINTAGASLIRRKGEQVEVDAITIDSLNLQDVSIIKIDVERAEPFVLRGAKETIERCRPALIVEALGDAERDAVMTELPDYELSEVMDRRNLLLLPKVDA